MFCILKRNKIYPAHVSKHNSNREKNYSFNDSKWKGMALSCRKKKHYSFATKNKLESDKNLFENKDFCNVIMPSVKLKEIFFNTCNFSKNDKNKFILLSRKGQLSL